MRLVLPHFSNGKQLHLCPCDTLAARTHLSACGWPSSWCQWRLCVEAGSLSHRVYVHCMSCQESVNPLVPLVIYYANLANAVGTGTSHPPRGGGGFVKHDAVIFGTIGILARYFMFLIIRPKAGFEIVVTALADIGFGLVGCIQDSFFAIPPCLGEMECGLAHWQFCHRTQFLAGHSPQNSNHRMRHWAECWHLFCDVGRGQAANTPACAKDQ